jgi:hypothetical protein
MKSSIRSATILAMFSTIACGASPSPELPDAGGTDAAPPTLRSILPAPSGASRIARGDRRTLRDASRGADGGAAAAGSTRDLSVEIWYPTDDDATTDLAPYLDDVEGPTAAITPATQWWREVATHTHRKAPFAHDGGRRPVVLFSPGYTVMPRMYTAIIEDLVSHGYVVVAISHPLWTSQTVYADGTTVRGIKTPDLDDARGAAEIQVWTRDAGFVLDRLAELDAHDPANEITGRLDLEHVGMIGHSFGGAAAVSLGAIDARIDAAVDLDGTIWGSAPTAAAPTPVLLFNATTHLGDPTWNALYPQTTGPTYWLTLGASAHFDFSDYGVDLAGWGKVGDPSILGTIDPARALVVVDRYLLAFLGRYLEGTPSPLLDAPAAGDPEVIGFQKRLTP